MAVKVAINGFGRIGRLVMRAGLHLAQLEVVGINDLVPPENLAYLFKYDTIHGPLNEDVRAQDQSLRIGDIQIRCTCHRDPRQLPWKDLEVDYVVESTGLFTGHDEAAQHLMAGAVALAMPELAGKLTGMAFRVPTADVSVVDLTVRTAEPTSYDQICEAMKQASQTYLRGVLGYCDEPVVSSDFVGCSLSSIFDRGAGIELNRHFFKLISWYDNEWGYSNRVVDLMLHMARADRLV